MTQAAHEAIATLQAALAESEQRIVELKAELDKKPLPKDKLSKDLRAAQKALKNLEGEHEKLKVDAGQLQEVVDSEKEKVAALKKKLAVAEAGPEKVSKKEVNFWRQKSEDFDKQTKEYKSRISKLMREIKKRDKTAAELESKLAEASATAELEEKIERSEAALSEASERASALESGLAEAQAAQQSLQGEHEELLGKLAELEKSLAAAASEKTELESELEQQRARAGELENEVSEIGKQLSAAQEGAEETANLRDQLGDAQSQLTAATEKLTETQAAYEARSSELEQAERRTKELSRSLEQANHRADITQSEVDQLRETLEAKLQESAELQDQTNVLAADMEAGRDQFAGLEDELKAEKEEVDRLNEVANERRETIETLEQDIEGLRDRVAELEWQVGKNEHFGRLVKRRRGLIRRLIAEVRTKQKANAALKAGIDSLRTFKAKSEENNASLQARLNKYKTKLRAVQQDLDTAHIELDKAKNVDTADRVAAQESQIDDLKKQLDAQAELIQTLEQESKSGSNVKRELAAKDAAIGDLESELQTKSEIIEGLQQDVDNLQRKAAGLRGLDSETVRLKSLVMQEQNRVTELEEQNELLKRRMQEQAPDAARAMDEAATDSEVEALQRELEKRELAVKKLVAAGRKQEAELEKARAAADNWRRKYQFLTADDEVEPSRAAER